MSVGKRISELRKKQGLTQEQLAEMLGTTRQAVSKWESEKTNPDLDYIISIGKIFHVSMDYLLLGIGTSENSPTSESWSQVSNNISENKKSRIVFFIVLAAGILILLLCPLFATNYRNYISQYEPAYTDPYLYLQEWPLVGIKIAGILSAAIGAIGVSWPLMRSFLTDTIRTCKEQ